MKCMSCQADIPPAWVHAINSNICPGCGGEIMDQSSQELLGEIREAMNQMPNNPEGIAGWLLTHYSLKKVGTAEPTDFHQRKVASRHAQLTQEGDDFDAEKPAGENLVNKFLKRTGVKPKDNSHFKNLVKQIRSGDNEGLMMDPNDLEDEINVAASEGMDDEDDEGISPILRHAGRKTRELKEEMAISGSAGIIRRGS